MKWRLIMLDTYCSSALIVVLIVLVPLLRFYHHIYMTLKLLPFPTLWVVFQSLGWLIQYNQVEKVKSSRTTLNWMFALSWCISAWQGWFSALWDAGYRKFFSCFVFESAKPRRFVVASLCTPACCVRKGRLSLRPSVPVIVSTFVC